MTHTSHLSRLDRIYRSVLLSRFFTKGWGRPEHLKRIFELRRRLANKDSALTHVDPLHPVTIVKDVSMNDHRLLEGYFRSPMADYLPELLPKESEKAHFQIILPLKWTNSRLKPVTNSFDYSISSNIKFFSTFFRYVFSMLEQAIISSGDAAVLCKFNFC